MLYSRHSGFGQREPAVPIAQKQPGGRKFPSPLPHDDEVEVTISVDVAEGGCSSTYSREFGLGFLKIA